MIILPNLLRYVLDKPSFRRLSEGLIRAQYILSAPLGSIGAVMLMLYPFNPGTMWSIWLCPAYLAYLVTFGRDLMHNGNRGLDLFRAISLNAMLLPINLSGAINSLQQVWTGRKIPFQRTPKVSGRTAATPVHIVAQFGLFLVVAIQVPLRFAAGEWLECLFFLSYAAAFGYAMHVFIGWQAAGEDLFGGLERRPRLLLKSLWEKSLVHKG